MPGGLGDATAHRAAPAHARRRPPPPPAARAASPLALAAPHPRGPGARHPADEWGLPAAGRVAPRGLIAPGGELQSRDGRCQGRWVALRQIPPTRTFLQTGNSKIFLTMSVKTNSDSFCFKVNFFFLRAWLDKGLINAGSKKKNP